MKSAIAILTYNRLPALVSLMDGINAHCKHYPTAIFDDLSWRDNTAGYLKDEGVAKPRPDLLAVEYASPNGGVKAFLAEKNLGVAGNSNRALKWFMEETDADHLCLLNDDLFVLGDFPKLYAEAHKDLGVGMFCFCDFTGPTYRWVDVKKRGYNVKLCPRMTGIMMSIKREVVEAIGYYDMRFGKFGEEHCDYTIRARFAGFVELDGSMQSQIDVHHYRVGEQPKELLKHQEVETSMTGPVRQMADAEASEVMQKISKNYRYEHLRRPFRLHLPRYVGGTKGAGIPVDNLLHNYELVTDFWPRPLAREIA
jgi:hypothetical protein